MWCRRELERIVLESSSHKVINWNKGVDTMVRKLTSIASIVVLVGLLSPLAFAQEANRYDFDGKANLLGDFDDDGDVDGDDFLIWQLEVPVSASDLTDWEDNYPTPAPADPTDWMTSTNWGESGFDPDINFGPLLPDFTTRVEIEDSKYGVNAPVIGPGDTAEAIGVRIGRFGGEGLLTMTGGTLDLANRCSASPFSCDSRLRVGNAQVLLPENRHDGTFNLSGGTVTTDTLWIGSGSHGEMNMSGGVVNTRGVFYFDWTGHNDEPFTKLHNQSVLNMTSGTVNVGTFIVNAPFRMYRESELNLDGGEILVAGSVELGSQKQENTTDIIDEIPDVTASITGGLLEAGSYLQVRGSTVLDGGILRADSFNETDSFDGTIEINGTGLLQFDETNETVGVVEALITSGFFFTTDINGLEVTTVDVSGTNFTQVAVAPPAIMGVPEPSSLVLAMLVSVPMVFRRRNFSDQKAGSN